MKKVAVIFKISYTWLIKKIMLIILVLYVFFSLHVQFFVSFFIHMYIIYLCAKYIWVAFDIKRCVCIFVGSAGLGSELLSLKQGLLHLCNICSYKTISSGHLKQHLLTHTGQKPYVCNICSKSFRQKGHLKTHWLTHTTERPFKCSKCGKRFLTKQNCNIHMYTCQTTSHSTNFNADV